MIEITTVKKLPTEILETILFYKKSYKTPIRCKIKEQIADLLRKYKAVKCYHCTKVISKENILKQGLHILNFEYYKRDVIEAAPFFTVEQKQSFVELYKQYDIETEQRNNKLYFTLNYEHVRSCYGNYCMYYGGEILRRVLGDPKEGDANYELLRNNGIPIVIECCIDFNEIDECFGQSPYEQLANSILNAIASENSDLIYCDVTISSNLHPRKIQDIHDYKL